MPDTTGRCGAEAVAHFHATLMVGGLALPNRVVAVKTATGGADDGGAMQPRILPAYARAAVEAGLVIAEPAWVSPQGVGTLRSAGIAREAHVPAWNAVTDTVHAAGGRIALPLWHAGRLAHPRVQPHGGWPVAPSAIAAPGEAETRDGRRPHALPRALDAVEIPAIVAAFAAAAQRARRAGFDAVEIHAADGGLLEQFLEPDSNRREDAHGASPEGRIRLLLEVVASITGSAGLAVGLRLAASHAPIVAALAGRGLAWLHLVPTDEAWARLAGLRAAFGGPVILGGAWPTEVGSAILADAVADAVALTPPSAAAGRPIPHVSPAPMPSAFRLRGAGGAGHPSLSPA